MKIGKVVNLSKNMFVVICYNNWKVYILEMKFGREMVFAASSNKELISICLEKQVESNGLVYCQF